MGDSSVQNHHAGGGQGRKAQGQCSVFAENNPRQGSISGCLAVPRQPRVPPPASGILSQHRAAHLSLGAWLTESPTPIRNSSRLTVFELLVVLVGAVSSDSYDRDFRKSTHPTAPVTQDRGPSWGFRGAVIFIYHVQQCNRRGL
ncbi:hypothetical protein VTH06DRAFT_811 [Thermothelomyces fergusii]